MREDERPRAAHEYLKLGLFVATTLGGALAYVWTTNDKFDRRIAELEAKKLQAEATVASLTAQMARLEKQGMSARGPQGERGPPGPQGERGPAGEKGERGLVVAAPQKAASATVSIANSPTQLLSGNDVEAVGSFSVELIGCLLLAATATCSIRLTAGQDGAIEIGRGSTVFDDAGDKRAVNAFRGKNLQQQRDGNWYQEFAAGVQLVNDIDFTNISPKARSLAMLDLHLRAGNGWEGVHFRNVPLQQK